MEQKVLDHDPMDQDDYDESADSDFEDAHSNIGSEASSTEDTATVPSGKEKLAGADDSTKVIDLDSGDEVTIKERRRARKKAKKGKQDDSTQVEVISDDDANDEGLDMSWRAKTRSMRARDQVERQQRRQAEKGISTIDVDAVFAELLRSQADPLPPVHIIGEESKEANHPGTDGPVEEMITIKRQFKFAGTVHVEEKIVPRSSAEAQLWLSQQTKSKQNPLPENDSANLAENMTQSVLRRPLRKISRFDPNLNAISQFINPALQSHTQADGTSIVPTVSQLDQSVLAAPKLNVVEKSKLDWTIHVASENLAEELAVAAKSKAGYLGRMDFLGQVEARKEIERRQGG